MSDHFELLSTPEILTSDALNLTTLLLDGVQCGSSVDEFPRDRIDVNGVYSPIVTGCTYGHNGAPHEFYTLGRLLTYDELLDDIFTNGGIVSTRKGVWFRIRSKRVVGFSLFCPDLAWFQDVRSMNTLLERFGKPDATEDVCCPRYGDLEEVHYFYRGSLKRIIWTLYGLNSFISHIYLGEFYELWRGIEPGLNGSCIVNEKKQ